MRHTRTTKATSIAILAAASLAFLAPAVQADSPPYASSPGCDGLIVGQLNHDGGIYGPSGNPNSSTGPGPSYGNETVGAIQRVRGVYCP